MRADVLSTGGPEPHGCVRVHCNLRSGYRPGCRDVAVYIITRELMPWMAEHYCLRGGRESTGMGGASLGGPVSLYLGLSHAGSFGRLKPMSPNFRWNKNSIFGFVDRRAAWGVKRAWVWLDVGDREGEQTVHDVELLAQCRAGNGWRAGEAQHFERVVGGTRDEASWSGRVRAMLRFLFPA